MYKVKKAGNLKFLKFSNSVKLCQAKNNFISSYHSGFMRRFPAEDFNILARNIFEIWAKMSKKLQFFNTPGSRSNSTNVGFVMRVHTGHHHDLIGYGLGLMVTKRAHQVDGWMDGWTDGCHSYHFTTSAFS
jgi:hypothetical protein